MNKLLPAALSAIAMLLVAAAPAVAQQRSALAASVAAAAVPVEHDASTQPGLRLPEAGASLLLEGTRDEMRMSVGQYRMWGALVGAAVGVLGYYVTGYQDDYCRDPDFFPCEPGFVVYGVGGAAVGLLAGHFVGKAANRR